MGMFFFPQNEHMRAQAMQLFEVVTRKEGLEFLAWRKVPVDPDAVGQKARDCMPSIWQCFIKKLSLIHISATATSSPAASASARAMPTR